MLIFNCVFYHSVILRTYFLGSKLHFCQHAGYLFCPIIKLLVLIEIITFSFRSLDSLLKLYIRLVGTKLEYASVSSNPLTNTDCNNTSRRSILLRATTEPYKITTLVVAFVFSIREYCTLYSRIYKESIQRFYNMPFAFRICWYQSADCKHYLPHFISISLLCALA
jgi:hypothetical protein